MPPESCLPGGLQCSGRKSKMQAGLLGWWGRGELQGRSGSRPLRGGWGSPEAEGSGESQARWTREGSREFQPRWGRGAGAQGQVRGLGLGSPPRTGSSFPPLGGSLCLGQSASGGRGRSSRTLGDWRSRVWAPGHAGSRGGLGAAVASEPRSPALGG